MAMANGLSADIARNHDAPARDRVWARYRDEELADRLASVPWNETLDTIMSHRSVRTYRDAPLPAGALELLIAAAQSAATTSNLQAWSVIACEDPSRKSRLSAFAAPRRPAPRCLPLRIHGFETSRPSRKWGARTGRNNRRCACGMRRR